MAQDLARKVASAEAARARGDGRPGQIDGHGVGYLEAVEAAGERIHRGRAHATEPTEGSSQAFWVAGAARPGTGGWHLARVR